MCQLSAISLFSGCGGSDFGLRKAGVSVFWANDVWEPACETYKINMPETEIVCKDIKEVTSFPRADLLIGCYPCQGFSQGGRRDPDADINQLYMQFGRALGQVKPIGFVVENVVGMTFGDNRKLLDRQIERFEQENYVVTWALLDAKDYGMAQERKRVFLVGVRSDVGLQYSFPEPTHGAKKTPYVSQQHVLDGFPLWPAFDYCRDPLSWYYMSRRRRREWHEVAPCVVGHARSVALHPVSPRMSYAGKDAYRFDDAGEYRRYTYRECAALQGFPADFKWGDQGLAIKYRLVGNAVPPPLFHTVSKPLVDLLS